MSPGYVEGPLLIKLAYSKTSVFKIYYNWFGMIVE